MECKSCGRRMNRNGQHRDGRQRWRCRRPCKVTALESRERLFGDMRVDEDKAVMALNLLCEGMSVRAASRTTELHKSTILKALVYAGEACERLKTDDPQKGDAYCFTAIERDSKLLLTWHLGRRTEPHTDVFIEQLDKATAGRFQITTDGLTSYPNAIGYHLGMRTDYAVLVKEYGHDNEDERRYSPPGLTGTEKTVIHGTPDPEMICTSIVERMNLSIRTFARRMTRLTCAFSKCWRNHKAALALVFAHYNFCRMHKSIQMTPAMKADLTRRPWSLRDLLEAATQC